MLGLGYGRSGLPPVAAGDCRVQGLPALLPTRPLPLSLGGQSSASSILALWGPGSYARGASSSCPLSGFQSLSSSFWRNTPLLAEIGASFYLRKKQAVSWEWAQAALVSPEHSGGVSVALGLFGLR